MTDRDTFAAAALTGMMARVAGKAESFAEAAYKLADAMLRERDKEQSHQDNRSQPSKRKWVHGCTGVLWDGEVGMEETDNGPVYKIGDGKTEWDDLPTLVKSTNHDAVPEARATTKPGGLNSGSASGTSGEQSPVTKPSSGTGDTQEPVAWAVMQNDWYHGAYLDYSKAVSLATAANVAGAKNPWNVVPLYRSPTLTDAEREAVEWCRDNIIPMSSSASAFAFIHTATLRKLLERLA